MKHVFEFPTGSGSQVRITVRGYLEGSDCQDIAGFILEHQEKMSNHARDVKYREERENERLEERRRLDREAEIRRIRAAAPTTTHIHNYPFTPPDPAAQKRFAKDMSRFRLRPAKRAGRASRVGVQVGGLVAVCAVLLGLWAWQDGRSG